MIYIILFRFIYYFYQFRLKGITKEAILNKSKEYGGLMEMYKQLYEGKAISFDLTDGRPAFEFNDNFTVSSLQNFIRTFKSDLPEGNKYYE